MKTPSLSIIVLTYNRQRLLQDCLASLLSQHGAADDLEIIVVDDGSSDDTRPMVAALRRQHPHLRYVHQPHRGIPAARNSGLRAASAPIVAIVADDYILAPDYATTVLRFFATRPDAHVVRFRVIAARDDLTSRLSHFYYEISFLNRLHPPPEPACGPWQRLLRYFRRIPLPPQQITAEHDLEAAGAAGFRKNVFDRVGIFDEHLQRGEDTDMTRRLRAHGIAVYYHPFHCVEHQYERWCTDTLRKCFSSGRNRYRLYRKYAGTPTVRAYTTGAVYGLADQFLRAVWRARQARRARQFFLYFPAMLLFESSVKAGFCWQVIASAWRGRRGSISTSRESGRGRKHGHCA